MDMNFNKKMMLSIMLIAILAIGVGAATYAKFNAKVTSTGNRIQAGKYTLNGKAGNNITGGVLFNFDKQMPGNTKNTTVFEAINTGDYPMNVTP